MLANSTRYAVFLGLAGSFAVAIAPAVQAQIKVTGGSTSGQAAFFVPTPGGDGAGQVEMFDVGIKQLQLITTNGNTSTAVFTPTATSFDAGADNAPTTGDKGTLQGTLTGIGFAPGGGTPVPFSNRDTILNFTLKSFNSNLGVIDGTLIGPQTPGEAPLVFLPNVEATVASGSTFEATFGELQLGDFAADLNDGLIDLSSSLVFRDSGSVAPVPPIAVTRRIKFLFEGENVLPEDGTDFDADDDEIRFVGEANKKFQIQSVGNEENVKFKIEGNTGAVDITISEPLNKTDDGLNEDEIVDKYKIEGESDGYASLFALNSVGFNGTAGRDTKYSFEQDGNKLEGRSDGELSFYAVAGVNSFNRDNDFDDFPYSDFDGGPNQVSLCNICGTTVFPGSTVVVGGNPVVVGSPIVVVNNPNTTNVNVSANIFFTAATTVNPLNVNVFSLAGSSSSTTVRAQYQILTSGNENSNRTNQRNRVRFVERGGDRYYIVVRGSSESSFTADRDNRNSEREDRDDNDNSDSRSERNDRQGRRDSDSRSERNDRQGRRDSDSRSERNDNDDNDNSESRSERNERQTRRDSDSRSERNERDDDDSSSGRSDQVGYKLVGPSSRCFPGLVGLRQISQDETNRVSSENPNTTVTTNNAQDNTTTATTNSAQDNTTSAVQTDTPDETTPSIEVSSY